MEKYEILDKDLSQYFIPKKDIPHTKEYVEQLQKRIGYTKTASMYIFKKNKGCYRYKQLYVVIKQEEKKYIEGHLKENPLYCFE